MKSNHSRAVPAKLPSKPRFEPIPIGSALLVDFANLIGGFKVEESPASQAIPLMESMEKGLEAMGFTVHFFIEHRTLTWVATNQANHEDGPRFVELCGRTDKVTVVGGWQSEADTAILQTATALPNAVCISRDRYRDFAGEYPEEAPFTIGDLETIYPAASARAKTDEAFSERAHQATLRLQQGDPGYGALFQHVLRVSKADLKKNYDALDVHFELWKGESDVQPYIADMLADFERQGILEESEGARVIAVARPDDGKEVPPCLVQKSDGAYLYATTDLATIVEREKLYHPAEIFYITDKRQSMHFEQVFRAARISGIVPEETVLSHLGFGTMNGKDGKPFKTRDGGVLRLEYLLKEVKDAVYARMAETDLPEEEKQATAGIIGLAALKYGDLSNQATKDYVFDLERFSSFEGNTGPYILYTAVRIRSILRKVREQGILAGPIQPAAGPAEKALHLALLKAPQALADAFAEKAPHKLCQIIYELSDLFSAFYRDNHILKEEDAARKSGWIRLLELAERELVTFCGLLGFGIPERM